MADRVVSVLNDIKLDFDSILIDHPGASKSRCLIMFNHHKPQILELYRKQSYDNYVTGGGTCKTDDHYKGQFQKYYDMGLKWEVIYEDIEVERNFN